MLPNWMQRPHVMKEERRQKVIHCSDLHAFIKQRRVNHMNVGCICYLLLNEFRQIGSLLETRT